MMVFFDLKTAPKYRFQANRIYERTDFRNPVPVQRATDYPPKSILAQERLPICQYIPTTIRKPARQYNCPSASPTHHQCSPSTARQLSSQLTSQTCHTNDMKDTASYQAVPCLINSSIRTCGYQVVQPGLAPICSGQGIGQPVKQEARQPENCPERMSANRLCCKTNTRPPSNFLQGTFPSQSSGCPQSPTPKQSVSCQQRP